MFKISEALKLLSSSPGFEKSGLCHRSDFTGPVIHQVCTSVILCHVSIAQVNHDKITDYSEMLLTVEQYKDSINRETCHLLSSKALKSWALIGDKKWTIWDLLNDRWWHDPYVSKQTSRPVWHKSWQNSPKSAQKSPKCRQRIMGSLKILLLVNFFCKDCSKMLNENKSLRIKQLLSI